jgi:hypothetical protein
VCSPSAESCRNALIQSRKLLISRRSRTLGQQNSQRRYARPRISEAGSPAGSPPRVPHAIFTDR